MSDKPEDQDLATRCAVLRSNLDRAITETEAGLLHRKWGAMIITLLVLVIIFIYPEVDHGPRIWITGFVLGFVFADMQYGPTHMRMLFYLRDQTHRLMLEQQASEERKRR